ncbi:MAG: DNA polymerase III subunit alpha [Bacteroidetes bacterium]|nr:DNA polymerase III subunit alpha [Bacteroidota bacterium]
MLNVHSTYSLKYGAVKPEEVLRVLQEYGYSAAAFTDINNTSSCLDFLRMAPRYGIRPTLGIDFRNSATPCFVGLAANNEGFKNLNDYLAFHLHQNLAIPRRAVLMSGTAIIYPFSLFQERENLEENEYIGVRISDLNRLRFSPWMQAKHKLVILHSMSFRNRRDFNMHRLLRAIDNNTLLSKLPKTEEGKEEDVFLKKEVLYASFREYPEIIRNTEALLECCAVDLVFKEGEENRNQKSYTGSVAEDRDLIRKICLENLHYRYPRPDERIQSRIQKELEIIGQKGFLSYFLINWDIVSYARSKGYFYVGRGSGANSIIAYLLRITDVDPIELDLYFERFINLYRQNPPDFDIDFSWTDREDMTRYIFERFPHVSLLGAYNTFQYRAVIRELGKVFGLPKHEIDLLSRGRLENRKVDQMTGLVLRYGKWIQDLPSHLSIHSSGILISEQPIHHYCATFLPPKGYPTTQFDMVVAEDAGLFKFDILSQRGLGKIKDTVEIVRQNHPESKPIDIHDIQRFKSDDKIKELLREGKAMGCFYVESPAMRMLLKKLRVDDYLGLVAASSIIRPGVSKSGMMKEYILRHRYPEKRLRAHQVMRDIMPDTYGVMVYQEDVIKVAHYFAGLSLAEADVLRRGMSGKYRSREEFAKVEEKFFLNCNKKGYSQAMTEEVWRQISSFAGYAFAKGHSASYAVESYQSLFLKAYYPLEYMVGVINNFGGFYSTELYVHEARMGGAIIHPPCINTSDYPTIIQGKDIYLGFMHLTGLETDVAMRILEDRDSNGVFESLDDFLDRVPEVGLEQLGILLRIDAFRFTGKPKRELLWNAHFRVGREKKLPGTASLFRVPYKQYRLPSLVSDQLEDAYDQIELLGFPLCSPFNLIVELPENEILAEDLPHYFGQTITVYGYLVTTKDTSTGKGERMNFGTFLDKSGHFFDSVHFPDVARRFPFRGRGVYAVTGRVAEEFGFYSIEVSSLRKINNIEDPRYSDKPRVSLNSHVA